jgi:hypothetical protein
MRLVCALLLLISSSIVRADGPKDNLADDVRSVPPPGVAIPAADRQALTEGLEAFAKQLGGLKKASETNKDTADLLPDVEVYFKAVHDALKFNEFFNVKETAVAKNHLKVGLQRAEELAQGKHPWTAQTGQVVRGYRSKIDGSVQPYGLVIPKGYDFKAPIRLDLWCHGRGETLSENNFIQSCQSPGQFASDKAIVLNLYGRYCCANKLAGEVDCFEALGHAKKHYAIDDNRLVMRGFSMGGAACWQFAVHFPSVWCAAAPGAGFAETAEFLNVFQNEKVAPTDYEKKLWHMYDCTDYALNLFNLPTVAYSGEIDKQKQAADIMAKAMKAEGLDLVHIIGPKTGHAYEKGAKAELIERIDKIAERGRNPAPAKLKFVTYTLHYNKCFWLTLTGLEQHWERAQVDAEVTGKDAIQLTTKNVTELTLAVPSGLLGPKKQIAVQIDGQNITLQSSSTGSCLDILKKTGATWRLANPIGVGGGAGLSKKPGLQGPIDDAFLDSFLMVRPTGQPLNETTGKWYASEMKHAATHWRQQFRGEAPIKDDKDITDSDIQNSNLVLWGDPASNAVLKKIADKLPIVWKDGQIVAGGATFDAATHVPLLIYPNPLNPSKYVVLNSGFTFREYDYLNNARQIPKLPDFAVVDITTPRGSRWPGKVATAGFFNEEWKLK